MSELEMITVIFVTNILYMALSSYQLSKIRLEVEKVLEQMQKEAENVR